MKAFFAFTMMLAFAGNVFSQEIAQPKQFRYPVHFLETTFPAPISRILTAERVEADISIHTSFAVNNDATPGIPGLWLPAPDKRNRIALLVKKEKALLPDKRTLAQKSFPALTLKFSISD